MEDGLCEVGGLKDVEVLVDAKFTAILDLNDDHKERTKANERDLVYLGFSIPDNTEPIDPCSLHRAVGVLDSLLKGGHRVYLHCTGGQGRSPTVRAAYFICRKGMTVDEAKATVLKERPQAWRGDDEKFARRLEEFATLHLR